MSFQQEIRFFVTDVGANKKFIGSPVITGMGLEFYKYSPPDLTNRKYFSVSDYPALFREYFIQSGWSSVEKDFVWSDGNESHLSLRLKPGFSGTLFLDVEGYLPLLNSNKLLSVYVNNVYANNFEFTPQNNRKKIAISVKNLKSQFWILSLSLIKWYHQVI